MSQELERAKQSFHQHVWRLQDSITQKIQEIDPKIELIEDQWQRLDHEGRPGGGGRTRVLRGEIFENAGVNTSQIFGSISPQFAQTLGGEQSNLWAAGISLILHPKNPRVPTVHMNFRMIHQGEKVWFGGGADLTPYYPHQEDFSYFHQVWKKACAPFACYPQMKKECDNYFVNHHRQGERRGVGGIFFDHYHTEEMAQDLKLVTTLSEHFIPSYFPLVEKRKDEPFNSQDEDFQLHRRGRYVEFNLLHDRGTTFGLKTGGRTESILVSLPARCKFTYNYRPEAGSPHEEMMSYYWPKDW